MKIKINQGFTTFDFLTMITSLAVVCIISLPIVRKNFQSNGVDIAQRDLGVISKNLINPRLDSGKVSARFDIKNVNSKNQSRGIASQESNPSDGEMAQDPWGRPYHYRFLKNEKNIPVSVLVWSDGPNQIPESDLSQSPVVFKGDDVGQEQPMR